MKANKPLVALLTTFFLLTGQNLTRAQQSDHPAQQKPIAPQEIVNLPKFDVTATPVDPYNATEAISAARTTANIIDTPKTINVVTAAMIRDISPNSLWDLASLFAGVSSGRGTGASAYYDRMTFRGFETYARTTDNFSGLLFPMQVGGLRLSPIFVDHVELIMGPDSVISPTGTAGGSLSAVTKSPLFTPGIDLTGEVGNYNANRISIDATGPLGDGKHMAYRVIAAYQDSPSFLPGSFIGFDASAQFTYKFSDTAKLTFKYFGMQERFGGTSGMSVDNGEGVYTPDTVGGMTLSTTPQPGYVYNGWNGDAVWSHRTLRDNTAQAELTAALSSQINMRFAAQLNYDTQNVLEAYPSEKIVETWDPTTGQETSVVPFNVTALAETTSLQHIVSRQVQVQNDVAGNFEVGGISLQPTIGWAYQEGMVDPLYSASKTDMPKANLYDGIYNPPIPAPADYNALGYSYQEHGWTLQAYAYLMGAFFNHRLFLSAGTSRVWADVNDISLPYVQVAPDVIVGKPAATSNQYDPRYNSTFSHTNIATQPTVQPWHNTYDAGVLFKALPNVALYYNFSTNAGLAVETPLWQAGAQHEFGVKTTFFNGRLSINVDHFQIKESNIAGSNPLYTTGQSTILQLYTNLTSHGEELNIVGGITKDISVIASYTQMHLRDAFGRRQRNIPDNMANMLVDYHFTTAPLKGSDVFIQGTHMGKVAGELASGFTPLGVPQQPGFYLPAYTVFNAGAGYVLRNYRFNLNVNNIFNTRAWWQAQSRESIQPYPGTNVTLTATVHF